jgi:starch phosphorylase
MSKTNAAFATLIDKLLNQELSETWTQAIIRRLLYSQAKDQFSATDLDLYMSAAFTLRDRLMKQWLRTQQEYYDQHAKRIYYLSMEFLMGRTLGNALINLDLYEEFRDSLGEIGLKLENLRDQEPDAALGNGGLGRLAACFLDSMATLRLPAYGYGLRYEFGMFHQLIQNGFQVEAPDNWLRYGNPWEIERPEVIYPITFFGQVNQYRDYQGNLISRWQETDLVMAMAYDTPIPGYDNLAVNTLRLWSSKAARELDLQEFNQGDYLRAVHKKSISETISKVLYPNDHTSQGRELRLMQEYLFVSATLQDIVRRFEKEASDYLRFPDKVAIQLNDTHPAIAIAELMRILVDQKELSWEKAWEITQNTCAYTNHTVMPEALECWSVELMNHVLPRHLQIIYEINRRFLDQVWVTYPGDHDKQNRVSLIAEDGEKRVRMAHLAIVGSHSVNGVSELHSKILKDRIFKDFYELKPDKFNNKTNGITQRRWLKLANPRLCSLIEKEIGTAYTTDLYALRKLIPLADQAPFRTAWAEVKQQNKADFTAWAAKHLGVVINPDTLFDFQVKRLHEYKRQLLNILYVVYLYRRLREDIHEQILPRTVFFGGKAAPGYATAKLMIKLVNSIANLINRDPKSRDILSVFFLPNYSVSMAQKIFPAAELSQQISTAGMEASGTGNMKFALNGALTIGTLDGANIEMLEEVGSENIFIFGKTAREIDSLRQDGYNSRDLLDQDPELDEILGMISQGTFNPDQPDLFKPLVDILLSGNDPFFVLADFRAYLACQQQVEMTYRQPDLWNRMAILNVANMGKFSSDRTIAEYNRDIWKATPISWGEA